MDEKKTIRLNKTNKEDFLTWLVNELKPSGWFNSFLATDEEGREYSVTLQLPFFQDETLEIQATAVNSDGSLSDWGSVIKFQCFQLSTDVLRLDIEYKKYPGTEDYINTILKAVRENFLIETVPIKDDKPDDKYIYNKEGQGWVVRFENEFSTFPDNAGFGYIHTLLKYPDRRVSGLALEAGLSRMNEDNIHSVLEDELSQQFDNYEMVDDQAIQEIYDNHESLLLELKDAKENGLPTMELELRIHSYKTKYVDPAKAMKIRKKTFNNDLEKSRQRVSKCIKAAYVRIEKEMPSLYSHLKNNIETGKFNEYRSTGIKWKT